MKENWELEENTCDKIISRDCRAGSEKIGN